MLKKIFTNIIIILLIIISLIYLQANRSYIAHMGFVNAFEAYIPDNWNDDIFGVNMIYLNKAKKIYRLDYSTNDFTLNRFTELTEKNPYIILGKAKENAKKFLNNNKQDSLNNNYTIEVDITVPAGYSVVCLANGEPDWLLGIAQKKNSKVPMDKLDKSKLFSYLSANELSIKELELFNDLQVLVAGQLEIEDLEDFRHFTDLKYLDYMEIINHTDIPDESVRDEIQKILPDCVIQDSGDTIVKE